MARIVPAHPGWLAGGARERSDALLGDMLEHPPAPGFVMDPDGRYLATNPTFDARYPERDGHAVSAADRAALAAGETVEREEIVRDGTRPLLCEFANLAAPLRTPGKSRFGTRP